MPKLFVKEESLATGNGKAGKSHAFSKMRKTDVPNCPGRDEPDLDGLRVIVRTNSISAVILF